MNLIYRTDSFVDFYLLLANEVEFSFCSKTTSVVAECNIVAATNLTEW